MIKLFGLNLNKEVNTQIVWDAGKAYLRNCVIKYVAAKNKERNRIYK